MVPPKGHETMTMTTAQMRAILPASNTERAKNMDDKETVAWWTVVLHAPTAEHEHKRWQRPLDARFYMGRRAGAGTVWCSVWVSSEGRYFAGHGRASGYGYHKRSAAFEAALRSAGISLTQGDRPASIEGAGESAMREAIGALMDALGYDRATWHLVECG